MRNIILRFLKKTDWWNRLVECDKLKQEYETIVWAADYFSSHQIVNTYYSQRVQEWKEKFNLIKFWWMKSL